MGKQRPPSQSHSGPIWGQVLSSRSRSGSKRSHPVSTPSQSLLEQGERHIQLVLIAASHILIGVMQRRLLWSESCSGIYLVYTAACTCFPSRDRVFEGSHVPECYTMQCRHSQRSKSSSTSSTSSFTIALQISIESPGRNGYGNIPRPGISFQIDSISRMRQLNPAD